MMIVSEIARQYLFSIISHQGTILNVWKNFSEPHANFVVWHFQITFE